MLLLLSLRARPALASVCQKNAKKRLRLFSRLRWAVKCYEGCWMVNPRLTKTLTPFGKCKIQRKPTIFRCKMYFLLNSLALLMIGKCRTRFSDYLLDCVCFCDGLNLETRYVSRDLAFNLKLPCIVDETLSYESRW